MKGLRWIVLVFVFAVLGAGLWFKVIRYRLPRPLPAGECTWYAAIRAKESGWNLEFKQQFGRDARRWGDLVRNGKMVDQPAVGSLMVLDAWEGNRYGHVAYVEEVLGDGRISVTHANMKVGVKVFERQGVPIRRADVVLDGGRVMFDEGGEFEYPVVGFIVRN